MRPIPCFDVQDNEYGCTFSLSDQRGALLYSVNSKNEQWRNIRMHMLNECVMRNRIANSEREIGWDGPGALICRDEKGYRIRFYSALGNELAHTDVYVTEHQCMDVYNRIQTILKRQHVQVKFLR